MKNYATWEENAYHPSGYSLAKRVDLRGSSHGGMDTPHVHEGKNVRPAEPDEIPKGKHQ